jgi:hypothetical protein
MNASPEQTSRLDRSYPVTSGRVVVRQRKESVLVYDRANKKSLRANADFSELLALCDGTRTVADIVILVAHQRSEDSANVDREVCRTLNALQDDGIVTLAI